jgi:four helix bundle protein
VVRTYRDLIAWQKAYALCLDVYRATRAFPSDERFGLVVELRKTARSVQANIAEGRHRPTRADYVKFLGYSAGSVAELETQLCLARDLGYLADDQLLEQLREVDRLVKGLRDGLLRSAS